MAGPERLVLGLIDAEGVLLDGGEVSAQERERLPAVAHALELQNPTDALLRRHRRDERVPAVE